MVGIEPCGPCIPGESKDGLGKPTPQSEVDIANQVRGGRLTTGNAAKSAPAKRSRSPGPSAWCMVSRTLRPYIFTLTTRPMPDHPSLPRRARALPVRRNRPGRGSSSTERRTAPINSGTSCHSSSRTGSAIARRAASASKRNAAASAGTSRRTMLRANRLAVVVFPEARGPTTDSAASCENRSAR